MRRVLSVGLIATTLCLALAACGRDPGTRAVTGGLLGAGGGAIIGGAAGSPGTGALIGGAAGAVGGAATAH